MMPPQLARAKRRPWRSEPRPVIELMPAINVHELRHAIPRYHGRIHVLRDVSLRYREIANIKLTVSNIEFSDHSGQVQSFGLKWRPGPISAPCSNADAPAVLFGSMQDTGLMPAAAVTKQSGCRRNTTARAVSASPPASSASSSAACQTSPSPFQSSQNGSTERPTSRFAAKHSN